MNLKCLVETASFEKIKKEAKTFLEKKYPGKLIIYDSSDFKTQKQFDQSEYIIHIHAVETAAGKDGIAFDISWK